MNKTTNILDRKKYAEISRAAATESIVLLRNENNILPLESGKKISLFGRSQLVYNMSGTGSGGMVNIRYCISILDAFKATNTLLLNENLLNKYKEWEKSNPFDKGRAWDDIPWAQTEMALDEKTVADAASESDIAVVIIGRTAGENRDNAATKGSYLLTDEEDNMIKLVCDNFDNVVVVLNVGNIIDMKWVNQYKPSAVLYCWQGGQEGGYAVHDVLTGAVSPSGRLTGTIAHDISDYPSTANFGDSKLNYYKEDIYVGYRYFESAAKESVLYPFGFGLSYTNFNIQGKLTPPDISCTSSAFIELQIEVKNTGDRSGKEVVQAYLSAPQGKLGKPLRSLITFAKTKELKPGQSEKLQLKVMLHEMASYDDSGITGNKSCFILEAGEYSIYVGNNVREAQQVGTFNIPELIVTQKLTEVLSPVIPFERMKLECDNGQYKIINEAAPMRTYILAERITENCPKSPDCTGDKGIKLLDVLNGNANIDNFVNQFSDFELCCLVRGEGMSSPKVTLGAASAFGGVTDALLGYGIPLACCTDGPSGIRLDSGVTATCIPCGTALGSTYNLELVESLFEMVAQELRRNSVDFLLGPGMNIHRNPLNGRNFEYFSEDPLITGQMAVAELKALHRWGVSGVVKHYATNNQEYERHNTDAAVSERALREIYLKGFELAVKEGQTVGVMSTYGAINGIWTAGNYDLLTTVLRDEWGFDGIVMTDWWAQMNDEGAAPAVKNLAAMVRAQNDLYMVVSDSLTHEDNLQESLESGVITRGELLRCAKNIFSVMLRLSIMDRYQGKPEYDIGDEEYNEEAYLPCVGTIKVGVGHSGVFDIAKIDTTARVYTLFKIETEQAGEYTFSIQYKIDADERTQNPIAMLIDNKPAKVIVFTGTNNEWHNIEFDMNLPKEIYAKLFFSHGGIELNEFKIMPRS